MVTTTSIGLTLDGCRERQQRLRDQLRELQLDGALISHRRHVNYLSGYWHVGRPCLETALLVGTDGPTVLAVGEDLSSPVAADQTVRFTADRLSTLVDNQVVEWFELLRPHMRQLRRLGCDEGRQPWLLRDWEIQGLTGLMLSLRRAKDRDEVELIKVAIGGAEALYARARELLAPGITEIEMFAELEAAAVKHVGEPITEIGNDFQCNTPGGLPRHRQMQKGEIAIFDVSVVVRGYGCDLCRAFVVGSEPSSAQGRAQRRVMDAISHVEATVKPGVSCKKLYKEVAEMLQAPGDFSFFHHLGHGIGISAHEAPRLNPNWDNHFQVGDVFTAEPGLYAPELCAGIRIEENYLVTPTGIEKLSQFPTDL